MLVVKGGKDAGESIVGRSLSSEYEALSKRELEVSGNVHTEAGVAMLNEMMKTRPDLKLQPGFVPSLVCRNPGLATLLEVFLGATRINKGISKGIRKG